MIPIEFFVSSKLIDFIVPIISPRSQRRSKSILFDRVAVSTFLALWFFGEAVKLQQLSINDFPNVRVRDMEHTPRVRTQYSNMQEQRKELQATYRECTPRSAPVANFIKTLVQEFGGCGFAVSRTVEHDDDWQKVSRLQECA